jgi:hypothetical protein
VFDTIKRYLSRRRLCGALKKEKTTLLAIYLFHHVEACQSGSFYNLTALKSIKKERRIKRLLEKAHA